MDMPPCNVTTGNTLRAVGLGRLTNQFNPRGQRKYQVLAAKDDEPFVPVVNTDDVLKASSCNKAGAVLLRRPKQRQWQSHAEYALRDFRHGWWMAGSDLLELHGNWSVCRISLHIF